MCSSYSSSCYRQLSAFSSISDHTDRRVSSPSIEPEAWLSRQSIPSLTPVPPTQSFEASQTPISSQPPPRRSASPIWTPSPDLFTALILNRDQLYRDTSVTLTSDLAEVKSPNRRRSNSRRSQSLEDFDVKITTLSSSRHHTPVPPTGQARTSKTTSFLIDRGSRDRSMSVVPYSKDDNGAPKVSKRRGRLPKKTIAKSMGKSVEIVNKKRPADTEGDQERATKVLKIKIRANTSKKVDTSGSLVPAKASTPEIIEILSDSEDEVNRVNEKKKGQERPTRMLSYLRGWRQPQTGPAYSTRSVTRSQIPSFNVPKAETPDSISDLTPGPTIAIDQVEDVVGELQDANEKARRLQQEMEKQQADAMLEKQKAETKYKQEVANLTRDLETERQRSRSLVEQLQNSSLAHEKLKTEYQALQARSDQEKRERKQEQLNNADILEDILKPKTEEKDTQEQLGSLRKDNTRLLVENAALKAAIASSQSRSTLSPVPSSTSSTAGEEKKEDNIRKMYIKTKRQHDILQAVANDLITCTRSMDLSSFGEFGRYMKRLRGALELEEGGHIRPALNVQKANLDDEWGSRGSRT